MHVTVCICTRNRGAGIVSTLRSLAASTHTDFDVVIIDQSTNDATAEAVQQTVVGDPRFSYVRSATVGLSVARNAAISQARGPIIAFTDDDCEVNPSWLSAFVAAFAASADVGMIFGRVEAAPHDAANGYIPAYHIEQVERIRSPWRMRRGGGIGANMAFRQAALQAVGPFDELLGAGGPFYSSEDRDMRYRLLKAGYAVLNTPWAAVIHDGFRSWEAGGKQLINDAYFATGATCMKHLRLGDPAILPMFFSFWWACCLPWKDFLLHGRRTGLGRFLHYTRGLARSFRYPVDQQRRVYLPRKASLSAAGRSVELSLPPSD